MPRLKEEIYIYIYRKKNIFFKFYTRDVLSLHDAPERPEVPIYLYLLPPDKHVSREYVNHNARFATSYTLFKQIRAKTACNSAVTRRDGLRNRVKICRCACLCPSDATNKTLYYSFPYHRRPSIFRSRDTPRRLSFSSLKHFSSSSTERCLVPLCRFA